MQLLYSFTTSISLVQFGFVNPTAFGDMCVTLGNRLSELCLDEFGGILDLQYLGVASISPFLIAGKHCPSLRRLSANYVDSPILGMEHFIRGCPKLEYLSIIGGDINNFAYPQQLGNFDLGMLPVCLSNLKELWINKLLNQQGTEQ